MFIFKAIHLLIAFNHENNLLPLKNAARIMNKHVSIVVMQFRIIENSKFDINDLQ